MDTEDLPAHNVPLTINEQVLLIQVITCMKGYQITDVS